MLPLLIEYEGRQRSDTRTDGCQAAIRHITNQAVMLRNETIIETENATTLASTIDPTLLDKFLAINQYSIPLDFLFHEEITVKIDLFGWPKAARSPSASTARYRPILAWVMAIKQPSGCKMSYLPVAQKRCI